MKRSNGDVLCRLIIAVALMILSISAICSLFMY